MDEENVEGIDNDLLQLEQDDDDDGSIGSDLSEEDSGGFSSSHELEGFYFPGDEKDWN